MRNDEVDIIQGLPNQLRTEVVMFLYKDAMEKLPFLQNKPKAFLTQLVAQLKLEYYSPGVNSGCMQPFWVLGAACLHPAFSDAS